MLYPTLEYHLACLIYDPNFRKLTGAFAKVSKRKQHYSTEFNLSLCETNVSKKGLK